MKDSDSEVQQEIKRLQAELVEAARMGDQELANSVVEQLMALVQDTEAEEVTIEKPLNWNEDPKWAKYCETLERTIVKIAAKYTTDEALREDCAQEARIGLYTLHPSKIRLYEKFISGEIDEKTWKKQLDKYCRNVIRNSVLSYLDSLKTGSWYMGRTRRVKNRRTGQRVKSHVGPRYSSLDELVEDSGLQVDEHGNISWDHISTSGLGTDLAEEREEPYERRGSV
jgi:hypothetical protein